jgi:hypothetical protein
LVPCLPVLLQDRFNAGLVDLVRQKQSIAQKPRELFGERVIFANMPVDALHFMKYILKNPSWPWTCCFLWLNEGMVRSTGRGF